MCKSAVGLLLLLVSNVTFAASESHVSASGSFNVRGQAIYQGQFMLDEAHQWVGFDASFTDATFLVAGLGGNQDAVLLGPGAIESSTQAFDLSQDSCTLPVDFGTGQGTGQRFTAFDAASVTEVPIPAALWLFGSALVGFSGLSRRTLG